MTFTVIEEDFTMVVQDDLLDVLEIDPDVLDLVIERVESILIIRDDRVHVIEVSMGMMGPAGPQGPTGPTGPAGGTGYAHDQILPASIWTINHMLGYKPGGVIVIDSGGNEVKGSIAYPTANQVVITFSSAFAGVAYAS